MDLQEEYFVRTKVRIPPLRYTNGSLLVKRSKATSVSAKWRVLNITYFNRDNDPGRFELRQLIPTHNGYKNRGIFAADFQKERDTCFWETYEDAINLWVRDFKIQNYQPVTDPDEIMMGCWEMLLFCYDGCVAEIPIGVQDMFHSMFDDVVPLQERNRKLLRSLELLSNNPDIAGNNTKYMLQGWSYLRDYVDPKHYAHWLAARMKFGG